MFEVPFAYSGNGDRNDNSSSNNKKTTSSELE
jgi:hypothetical protein